MSQLIADPDTRTAAPTKPRTLPSPLWWTVTAGILLLVALAVYTDWIGLWTAKHMELGDFHSYVATGHAVLDGKPLYEPGVAHLPTIGGTFKYTPFAGMLFTVLAILPAKTLPALVLAANLIGLLAAIWVSFTKLGYQRDQGLVAATVAVGAVCLGLEPVLWGLTWGQVNLVLMVLVLVDLALPDGSRWKGIGVGVATAVKLVPGIFVVYLLLTKRFRAAATSIVTFAVTVGLGFLFLPHESKVFWTGDFADADRVTGAGAAASPENQTVRGQLARIFHSPDISTLHWLPFAAVLGVLAMAVAVVASRQGRELLAISVVGATGVLVSPLGWSHYWVWFVPFLVMGVSAALTRRSRGGWLAVAAGYLLLFAWPTGETWGLPFPGLMFVTGRYPPGVGLLLQSIQVVVGVLLLALAAVDVLRNKPADRSFLA